MYIVHDICKVKQFGMSILIVTFQGVAGDHNHRARCLGF